MLRALVGGAAVLGVPAAAIADVPERANFDARPEGDGVQPAAVERAGDRLRERLGRFGALSHDPRTGTLRAVGRLDGFLTGPSGRDGGDVALDYVSDNATAFGLDGDDLSGLRLVDREFVDGVEHLSWEQRYRGVPAVDSGLEAAVTGSGRLVALTGPPAADLAVRSVEPAVGARAAYDAARDSAGAGGAPAAIASASSGAEQATRFADGGRASLALYSGESGYRLAWRVLAPVSSTAVYDVVVDARSGAVVRRANRVNFANAKVFEYHPEHAAQVTVDFDDHEGADWLTAGAALSGPNAHAFVDVHDVVGPDPLTGDFNFTPEPGSDVTAGNYEDILQTLAHHPNDFCAGTPGTPQPPPTFACSWNPLDGFSWQVNRDQSATQLFYYVNRFHDHLENDPGIAFTEGNFEGSDRVLAQALDGADTAKDAATGELIGLPDDDHFNNANFTTLPEGQPGLMQMYLWQPDPDSSNDYGGYDGANDASLVYHEYTHGLSNRLVTDAQGFGALNTAQAGALGEGWSDFYAMDFIEGEGLESDQAGTTDLHLGEYVDNGGGPGGLLRNQAIDCAPDSNVGRCEGGYTYAQFGTIDSSGPDVHADGEIWAQTLWSIRKALIDEYTTRLAGDAVAGRAAGIAHAREYVTGAMRIAPDEPSFVDVRNAMLLASPLEEDDEVMWKVFAERGMGYFAGSDSSEDVEPRADFTDPDELNGIGTVTGRVLDENGQPVAGATVSIAGLTGLGEQYSGVSASDGTYLLDDVRTVGGNSSLRVRKDGFQASEEDIAVEDDPAITTHDLQLVRDFSSAKAAPTSARISSFTGEDNTDSGCGPGGLIDDNPATVWGTENNNGNGHEIIVELAAPIDVGRIAIDPGAGCGDDKTAALRGYEVLVARTPGGEFQQIAAGEFNANEIYGLKEVYASDSGALGVRYIKLRAKTPQDASEGEDGAKFIDVAELHVARTPGTAPGLAANTGAAHGVGTTTATLAGTVIPHSGADQVWFEYGATPSFGLPLAHAGLDLPAGTTAVPVSAAIGGLQPSTRYYFQVVARRGLREYRGGIQSFVTGAVSPPPSNPPPSNPPPTNPPPTNPPPTSPPSNPPPTVRPTVLLDTRLTARRKGTFKVRAFFGDAAPAGDARFTVIGAKSRRYARAWTPVRIGGNVTKTLKLTRKGRRAIRPGRSKLVTLELRLPNGQKIKKSLRLARSKR